VFSCGYEHTGNTQLMRPGGKDGHWSVGTAKHSSGMTSAAARCSATEHTSSWLGPWHLVPGTMLLMSHRHPTQAKSHGAGMGEMVSGARAPCQPPSLGSDQAGGGTEPGRGSARASRPALGSGMVAQQKCPCCHPWALTACWLDFGDEALTSTGNYAPKCEPFNLLLA